MSTLLQFYRLQDTDSEGRRLDEMWQWPIESLEFCHDFIQWMFPLDEPSSVNADAPLVTAEDREAFRREPALREAMNRSLALFMHFLGLAITDDGRVVRGEHFDQRLGVWKHANHNWLRVTRVIKSLRLLGFEAEAQAFWRCLKELHQMDGYVSDHSFTYWRDAAEG
jgi:hypothetical protein